MPTLRSKSRKSWWSRLTVVVLPLVPVTATTFMSFEGWSWNAEAMWPRAAALDLTWTTVTWSGVSSGIRSHTTHVAPDAMAVLM